jgi:pentalenene synthase
VPQDVVFSMPYPCQVAPDPAGARHRNLAWARAQGLLGSDAAAERYLTSQVADLAAYAYPGPEDDLDLAYDAMGWFFLYDDQFELSREQRPDRAIAATESMITLLFDPAAAERQLLPPISTAFADLWQRMCQGMSDSWRYRAAGDWLYYLTGILAEDTDYRSAHRATSGGRLSQRLRTIGFAPSLALAERAGHFEVPTPVWHGTQLQELRTCATEHIILVNEVFSLEKEESRGEANLVHLLMREQQCSRTDAIQRVTEMADARMTRLVTMESGVPEFCERLGLREPTRSAVMRHAESTRNLVRGSYYWHRIADRYRAPGPLDAEDLISPRLTSSAAHQPRS